MRVSFLVRAAVWVVAEVKKVQEWVLKNEVLRDVPFRNERVGVSLNYGSLYSLQES
jgi:hypothetical protein